eukprot:287493_1
MNRIKNTTPFKTNDIILPPNIKTPINYQQHYQQTHNTPITTKPTIDTLYTYKPVTSITSITTSYNQLLHIPNTISYGPFTSTNQITCINSHGSIINTQIKNQHVRFDPIIDNLTYVLLALYITLADYLCPLYIKSSINIFILSYGNIISTHQYHQKYNHKTTPYRPPITTTTPNESQTHTLPITINLQQNITPPPNVHITTKSNDKNISEIFISSYIPIITTPYDYQPSKLPQQHQMNHKQITYTKNQKHIYHKHIYNSTQKYQKHLYHPCT